MRSNSEPQHPQSELFQVKLERLIDMNHALVRLAENIAWERFDVLRGSSYHPSHGAPGISARLMVAPHYLKYQHDLSDETKSVKFCRSN
jgi:IS5 family transposase